LGAQEAKNKRYTGASSAPIQRLPKIRLHLHTETNRKVDERKLRWRYRLRVSLFIFVVICTLLVLSAGYEAIRSLTNLEQVERARDQWQRPSEVIEKLNLKEGSVVVDLGSGVGYFTLKLSRVVGKSGKVLPVDIKKFPLWVLRTRAFLKREHNVDVILGEPDDPHLPTGSVDAVLILNTYHELTRPAVILDQLSRSLKSGGHLVIVDRAPSVGHDMDLEFEDHAVASLAVEATLRRQGFEVTERDDHFTEQPDDGLWWTIVARKPP
jgi:ubiquinone/menaquinone biosynthesis C-methylase UbiE